MNPGASRNQGPGPGPNRGTERKGSVRRAREMLEAGRRPKIQPRPSNNPAMPPLRQDAAHMTQWPLPNDNLPAAAVDPHGRLFVPKGPPPQRPPRPDVPSPSVYSERSVSDAAPSPLHFQQRPVPSFSQPLPRHPDQASIPRSSIATDELYRQSDISSAGSIPSIPDFPFPALPTAAPAGDITQRIPRGRTANLAPPTSRPSINRRSSVSPIPEESPSGFQGSIASSRVIPSSWGSGPAESEILGTYLDVDSDDSDPNVNHEAGAGLVRQASLGKRGKPSLRTIQRSTTESPAPQRDEPPNVVPDAGSAAISKEVSAEGGQKQQRDSFLTSSSDSSLDPEKPPIVLDEPSAYDASAIEKETGVFPKAVPTMSDKRPGGRRPPRLDINAVRDAEKRGSLTSLPDLIRRATKLATNLEHGRTASRNDLLNIGGPRFQGHAYRKSGSIRSILASFPPPAATPENGHRSSWPVFFRRSTLHHIDSNETGGDGEHEKGNAARQRRCCGMRPWVFILVLLLVLAVILVAVLVPVFLVAIPKSHASSDSDNCATTTPCHNGGVSVSSSNVCSCVCTNGFTGSQCTVAGDASCVTTTVAGKNATVGSDLPRLFTQSSDTFDIDLDPTTIMALFSQNNVSCTTENALVSFRGVAGSSSSSKTRRSASRQDGDITLAARGATATANGIVFDNSGVTKTKPSPTATAATTATTTTSEATASATATTIPSKAVDFSRVAVLYILEKTGTLGAAMLTEDRLETFLQDADASSISSRQYTIDLADAGLIANFTLDFGAFQISKS
ncbi:hypothetical protein BDV59DRAFT_14556 [Aspergillus ambiguus]|uniref:uncharacterized protein n=1 Tax=Aspergillus ambiguus TaxID=176160 RepID=UPI003CCC9837